MSYGMSARAYLKRAAENLKQNDPKYLFYAAFELRCAVEERMRQYLGVWDHVSKKQKQGWEIPKLGLAVEKAFKTDKIASCRLLQNDTSETLLVLYYTPVTKKLSANAMRLGNYLHAPKKYHPETDKWWTEFRTLLEEMLAQTKAATTGTLLGPPLLKGKSKSVEFNMEVPPGVNFDQFRVTGAIQTMSFEYLDDLPQTLEPEAVVWRD